MNRLITYCGASVLGSVLGSVLILRHIPEKKIELRNNKMVSIKNIDTYFKKNGIFDSNTKRYVYNGANAINKLECWDFIKNVDPNNGFISSNNKNVNNIYKEIEKDDHSAFTFAYTLRILQKIANEYIKDDDFGELCTICLSDKYSNNIKILDCGHIFHKECINDWADIGTNCPVCRLDSLK